MWHHRNVWVRLPLYCYFGQILFGSFCINHAHYQDLFVAKNGLPVGMQSYTYWNGSLTRFVKLWFAHALGMPGTFSLQPTSKESASKRSQHASRHVRDDQQELHWSFPAHAQHAQFWQPVDRIAWDLYQFIQVRAFNPYTTGSFSSNWYFILGCCSKSKSQSQKCFIAIQEKVYIDQNNKTEAHSGLFVPLIWEYHCIILTSFWFNRLVGCKGPADTWHDEVITTFKLHDIFLIQ